MAERIFARDIYAAEGAEAWRVLPEGAYAFFRTDSFAASARFVAAISGVVPQGHEPHVDIRGDGVTVLIPRLKGAEMGLVRSDLELAQAISTAARGMGLNADPAAIQSLLIIPRRHRSASDHAVLADRASL